MRVGKHTILMLAHLCFLAIQVNYSHKASYKPSSFCLCFLFLVHKSESKF